MMRKLMARDRNKYEADYAGFLFNRVPDLLQSGKDNDAEEALKHATVVLDIRQRLFRKDPSRFASNYADSLSLYSSSLGNLGRYKEALPHAQRAVEIYQKIINANRGAVEADYAEALHGY